MAAGMDYNSSMRTHGGDSVSDIIVCQRQIVREPLLRERLLAELVGTFFLVLTVCLSVAGGGALAAVAIGLVLGVEIYTFGAVSGGFFNPAVTLAVLLSGRQKISAPDAALYMLAQCTGALLAGFAGFGATGTTFCFDYALTRGWGTSLELEILFTMALCGTVLATGTSNDAPNHYFGFAIGLTVTGGALACGGFDQGSFNPAVTLGVNLANYANSSSAKNPSAGAWALFLLAPMVGGVLASAVFRGTRANEYVGVDVLTAPPPALKALDEAAPGTPKSQKSCQGTVQEMV
mmetsp:Transcript_75947/g.169882  ORF Transcript_75947/g.169882 Transcript_75947/m.169882 type:complete len:291 (-) Transcript_75947:120-992(-)